ncbi:retrovirus-related Pol polyprotein from transposon TNT 1-94 [Gossypium australe]|uniref:Retrovirus-related Pol polyprotein from transposon TNT 1-94 n=1 Tax=Gossypium australe TaxID=47621 RepID=A0A5B6W2M9_9ROSI|nr:retrovirus-related Pol polyprotein from transposon TNT 1-94 [Gossypium australe]
MKKKKKQYRSNVQCYYCKKYGHVKAYCWKREKQAKYAEGDEDIKLFMAYQDDIIASKDIWFLDSDYSNHMTGIKSLFKELDESYKVKMQVEGKGTVAINNGYGNIKLLYNVYFIPTLSQNLLSIGQLMGSGYSV